MAKYIAMRLFYLILTVFMIASVTFFLMKMLPGTPLTAADKLSEEQQAIVLNKYHLNDPVPVQYVRYMSDLATGDLGVSFQFDNRAVTSIISERIGPSVQIGTQALVLGTIIGLALGMISAIFHNSALDTSSTIFAVFGQSIPGFIFAGLLQYFLGVQLGWFPVAMWGTFAHTVLPTLALAIFPMAITARFMRTEMLEVLGSDYITTARAKGLNRSIIIFKHTFKNSLIPVITVLGPLAVGLMTGTFVIETIFAVPGIGDQFVKSISTNDFPIIMATTLILSVAFVTMILIIDLLYSWIDPRIRLH
ncbi:ABC transporter permease [Halobacillus yeomjeoni]|uniref:ABC transporter permease n=1 Tax=Halobacillus yeomjeoni TaxID=311194 RepID=UPI001CD35312|nr:ABC transporter permease [Halobacillus yeomjeoni]MCA0982774.1 ABC transporter permease [Halobacillus yeomjeoni]